jgi:hypothetical protein
MDRQSRNVVSVAVDDSDPRDPTARCDLCGKQGTIARATRHSDPPLVLRYCGTCWPAAADEVRVRQPEEHDASWSTSSRSWHDVRGFLKLVTDAAKSGVVPKEAQLASIVQEISSIANEMDGPMPADVKEFLMNPAGCGITNVAVDERAC